MALFSVSATRTEISIVFRTTSLSRRRSRAAPAVLKLKQLVQACSTTPSHLEVVSRSESTSVALAASDGRGLFYTGRCPSVDE